MKTQFTSSFPIREIQIGQDIVFYEDSQEEISLFLSSKERKEFLDFLHRAQLFPKKTYNEFMTWKDALLQGSQNNPWIDNLLAYLHLQNKQQKKAEALIVSSYQKYPGYVFAKINYADQCLRQRKFKQIPLIFPSFELKTLYPHKKRFHVSEFRGLMIIASRYHALIGDRSHALLYYQKAYQADPSHPSLVLLEKELFSWRFSWKRCLLLFRRSLTLLGVTKR